MRRHTVRSTDPRALLARETHRPHSWTCDASGVTHDRDANASQNILAGRTRSGPGPIPGNGLWSDVRLLIARIYALPLSRVRMLRHEEVAVKPTGVTLWPDADALELEESLADAFRAWIALKGLLFEAGDHQPGVFRPQYDKCGNRNQLDPSSNSSPQRPDAHYAPPTGTIP